jgi:hypothetical protein
MTTEKHDPWALLREARDHMHYESRLAALEAKVAALKGATEKPEIRSVKAGELEWQADVPVKRLTWQEATDYAASLGNGWRLPTRTELLTLVDDTRCDPACSVFPDCPSEWFWTSTPWAGSSSYAWFVDFYYGNADSVDVGSNGRVRCVR